MHFILGSLFLTASICCAYGSFLNFGDDDWFSRENSEKTFNQNHRRFDNSGGNAAAAGKAKAHGKGDAISINQADHHANRHMTSSNALSANAANGWSPITRGEAQAGGEVNFGHRSHTNFERERNSFREFRRKRQVGLGYIPYRMGGFGSSADASSVGAGSALDGFVNTHNVADTQTNPWSAHGFAAGSASGGGLGVDLFNAANSHSQTFRRH